MRCLSASGCFLVVVLVAGWNRRGGVRGGVAEGKAQGLVRVLDQSLKFVRFVLVTLLVLVSSLPLARAQSRPKPSAETAASESADVNAGKNFDESKVPTFVLPDPLTFEDGRKVGDAAGWRERRGEIRRLFEEAVYGRTPAMGRGITFRVKSEDKSAYGGKATRRVVTIYLLGREDGPAMELLMYLPNGAARPVPMFLVLNYGNHTINTDPAVEISANWVRDQRSRAAKRGATTEPSGDVKRGTWAQRWPVERMLERGYGLATAYCGDVDPDIEDGFKNGIQRYFWRAGQEQRGADEWGMIGGWAWEMSRAMDYLVQDRDVDGKRVAIMGHSRLGKAALWAGAQDERFALTISSCAGCGGSSLARRRYGETIEQMTAAFPDWFAENYRKYGGNEAAMPVDQHELIALIAPRPVYIVAAVEDRWADPKGAFLAAKGADAVYRLLGTDGLAADAMPAVEKPVVSTIGFHIRPGIHDVTEYDWEQYLNFADRHLRRQ